MAHDPSLPPPVEGVGEKPLTAEERFQAFLRGEVIEERLGESATRQSEGEGEVVEQADIAQEQAENRHTPEETREPQAIATVRLAHEIKADPNFDISSADKRFRELLEEEMGLSQEDRDSRALYLYELRASLAPEGLVETQRRAKEISRDLREEVDAGLKQIEDIKRRITNARRELTKFNEIGVLENLLPGVISAIDSYEVPDSSDVARIRDAINILEAALQRDSEPLLRLDRRRHRFETDDDIANKRRKEVLHEEALERLLQR